VNAGQHYASVLNLVRDGTDLVLEEHPPTYERGCRPAPRLPLRANSEIEDRTNPTANRSGSSGQGGGGADPGRVLRPSPTLSTRARVTFTAGPPFAGRDDVTVVVARIPTLRII
jgi:hypothetical protein